MRSRQQRGYLSVVVALFLIVLALSLVGLFDSLQLTRAKTRLQHTADAAAWSAAVMQARELNFHAYMNRASVANQVVVGQMVSLSSFLQMHQQVAWHADLVGEVLRFIPYVGPAIHAALQTSEHITGGINLAAQYAGSNLAALSDVAVGALSRASRVWHRLAIAQMTQDLRDLVAANDPQVELSLSGAAMTLADLRRWHRFIRLHDPEAAERGDPREPQHRERLDEFRQVVLDSRDGFALARNQTFLSLSLLGFEMEMRQLGGSHLGSLPGKRLPYYAWSAVDTLSLWTRNPLARRSSGRRWQESWAAGWGRQATWHEARAFSWQRTQRETHWSGASQENLQGWSQVQLRDQIGQGYLEGRRGQVTHIGHFKVNDGTLNQGFGKLTPNGKGHDMQGLRAFHDLAQDNRLRPAERREVVSAATPIHIFLRKPLPSVRTSAQTGSPRPDGPLATVPTGTASAADDALFALAAGAALFEKPWFATPETTRFELANLYNPYWQPKLVNADRSTQARLLALGRGGS